MNRLWCMMSVLFFAWIGFWETKLLNSFFYGLSYFCTSMFYVGLNRVPLLQHVKKSAMLRLFYNLVSNQTMCTDVQHFQNPLIKSFSGIKYTCSLDKFFTTIFYNCSVFMNMLSVCVSSDHPGLSGSDHHAELQPIQPQLVCRWRLQTHRRSVPLDVTSCSC